MFTKSIWKTRIPKCLKPRLFPAILKTYSRKTKSENLIVGGGFDDSLEMEANLLFHFFFHA